MKVKAFDICQRDPWAITPEGLENILKITGKHSNGDEIDIDAVSAKLGRPLDNTRNVTVRDGVAVIPVSGPIFRFASFYTQISGATSVQDLSTDLTAALEDPDVKSIVFDVDSPGGQVSGVQEFSRMIFEARGRKPMVTYSGDLAASAAYWIGSATDKFFAAETARIGSIGVVAVYSDSKKAAAKAGVQEFKFISSKSPKKQPDPSTKEGASDIQGVVDDLADIFISAVARNRGVSSEKVEGDFGQGAVMIAEKALDAGMIDGISTFEAVIESMTDEDENEPRSTRNSRFSGQAEGGEKAKETLNMSDKKPEETKPEAIVVDRQYLDANHPGIVKSIQEESAAAERERISAIDENTIPGHEDLAKSAKADGTAPGAFALQMVGAEKEARKGAIDSIEKDAPKPPKIDTDATEPAAKKVVAEDATPEEKAEAAWESEDKALKSKFIGGKDSYVKAFVAEENGQVKSLRR